MFFLDVCRMIIVSTICSVQITKKLEKEYLRERASCATLKKTYEYMYLRTTGKITPFRN